ncbi:hypothetical protein [Streptomyces sp. NPDC051546]|uniref:hypothetical protein n=1 Tax=Streptomyces sp. NPDC051546 TaxID=3365655 RepID=UPI0037A7902D
MTRVLSFVIGLLLRAAGPLFRRGLPHLAMAAMAALVCGAALAAGHGLLRVALCLPVGSWPLAAVVLALLGAVVRLAGSVGLVAVILLLPLAITADALHGRPATAGDERPDPTR